MKRKKEKSKLLETMKNEDFQKAIIRGLAAGIAFGFVAYILSQSKKTDREGKKIR